MRITIEMTEAERRSTVIGQEAGAGAATMSAAPEAAAINGGSPPESLLLALGARSELSAATGTAESGDRDAGGPPSWLVDMLSAGVGGRQATGPGNGMGRK